NGSFLLLDVQTFHTQYVVFSNQVIPIIILNTNNKNKLIKNHTVTYLYIDGAFFATAKGNSSKSLILIYVVTIFEGVS
ncbi:hypothetical protein, partial [Pseudoalteromonas peptidolytica]